MAQEFHLARAGAVGFLLAFSLQSPLSRQLIPSFSPHPLLAGPYRFLTITLQQGLNSAFSFRKQRDVPERKASSHSWNKKLKSRGSAYGRRMDGWPRQHADLALQK